MLSVDNRSADKQPTQYCLFLLFLAKTHTQGLPGPGSALGHEDAFPPPTLSARCRFSQETFVGTRGNARDVPTAVI